MKKICMIIPKNLPLPATKGGAIETLITNVINENEMEKKIDLTVVSVYDPEAYKRSKNYQNTKFIYINSRKMSYKLKALWYFLLKKIHIPRNTYNDIILQKIKNEKYDYIIAEDGAYDFFNKYLKYFPKEKMVLHLHHTIETTKNIEKTFDKIITVSNYVKNVFAKNSLIKNIYVLPNAVDIANFTKKLNDEEKINLKKSLHIKKDDYVLIYCGRLASEKGIIELVKAVNNLKLNKIKLMIVGSINFAENGTNKYTNDLQLDAIKKNRVIFTGYVPNELLYKYYDIADLMVIPSICEEAAGLVCIEGMLSRIPIITTGNGGIKEYVKNYAIYVNTNNIIKDLEEKINYCYHNQSIILEKVNNAYKHALQYSTHNYFNNLVKIIEKEFKK